MNSEDQLKLQALLDGELSPDEARTATGLLQRDPAAAALLAELKAARQLLRQAESPRTVAETREFYWSKIEREIAQLTPRSPARPHPGFFAKLRVLILPAAAAAVLVIVGLALQYHAQPVAPAQTADRETTTVEPTLASTDATTYRDAKEGTTLVWFSDKTAAAPDTGTNGAN